MPLADRLRIAASAPRALVEAVWVVIEKIERRLSPACPVNAGYLEWDLGNECRDSLSQALGLSGRNKPQQYFS